MTFSLLNAHRSYYIVSASPAALFDRVVIDLSGCTIPARRVLWVPSTLPVATASLAPMEEETSFIGPVGKDLLHGASQSIISLIAGSRSGCMPCLKLCIPPYLLGMLAMSMCVDSVGKTSSSFSITSLEAVRGSIQSLAHFQSVGRYDGASMTYIMSVRVVLCWCFVGQVIDCGDRSGQFDSLLRDLIFQGTHPRVSCQKSATNFWFSRSESVTPPRYRLWLWLERLVFLDSVSCELKSKGGRQIWPCRQIRQVSEVSPPKPILSVLVEKYLENRRTSCKRLDWK